MKKWQKLYAYLFLRHQSIFNGYADVPWPCTALYRWVGGQVTDVSFFPSVYYRHQQGNVQFFPLSTSRNYLGVLPVKSSANWVHNFLSLVLVRKKKQNSSWGSVSAILIAKRYTHILSISCWYIVSDRDHPLSPLIFVPPSIQINTTMSGRNGGTQNGWVHSFWTVFFGNLVRGTNAPNSSKAAFAAFQQKDVAAGGTGKASRYNFPHCKDRCKTRFSVTKVPLHPAIQQPSKNVFLFGANNRQKAIK